jgi:pSer/pThr/pTyr-binding forkhead associated (FHA) protein
MDNPSLTFGRNLTCDVRLYYPEVEGVHARVVWEDEGEKNRPKATLHVLGESGVYVLGPGGAGKGKVEGKWVYPRYPDEDGDENEQHVEEDQGPPQPTIVELPNNAEFEIAHKRFRVGATDGAGVLATPAGGKIIL